MDNRINYKETTFGFEYGSARVERIASDGKKGWVYFSILTPKNILYLYVTKTGRVKVTDEKRVEWLPDGNRYVINTKPVKLPPLPDGLDDEKINHYHFKQGWVECWKAIEKQLK